jgi:hypothetical protein
MATVMQTMARTLAKGGLALLLVGVVLVVSTAWSSSFAVPDRPPGAEAHWQVDPADPPDANARSFVALVWRAGCGGVGPVYPPTVVYGEHQIVVTFTVAPNQGGECPVPPPERWTVELEGRLAGRDLVDSWCLVPEHTEDYYCEGGAVRWSSR